MIYIYGLLDSVDGDVRYVGKTVNLRARLTAHRCQSSKKYTRLGYWLRSLGDSVAELTCVVLEELPDSADWATAEKQWIHSLRADAPKRLLNIAEGGNGSEADRGIKAHGESHFRARLTDDIVKHILTSDEPTVSLAKRLGLVSSSVHAIRARKQWKHVTVDRLGNWPKRDQLFRCNGKVITAEVALAVLESSEPACALIERFGISSNTVQRIRNRQIWGSLVPTALGNWPKQGYGNRWRKQKLDNVMTCS